LEENAHYLHVMGQMQLAWLNAERSLYCGDEDERSERLQRVEVHLNELARWQALHGDETWRGTWDHRHQQRRRLASVEVGEFLRGFRRYFGL
jgi:hypothetical protein